MVMPDRNYIKHRDDLIALGGDKEHSWVHGVFENLFTRTSRRLSRKLFQTDIQALKTKNPDLAIFLYSKARFDKVVATFFILIIIALIMAPVLVLSSFQDQIITAQGNNTLSANAMTVRNTERSNYVILGCVTGFALFCSTCTTAKRHEVFAATVAYCAVLTVFVGQNGST